jgi:hypothetical protein
MPPANGSASWEVEVIDEHRVVGPASLTWPLLRVPCHLATSTAREAPERDAIRVGDARRLAHLRRRCGGTGRSGPGASGPVHVLVWLTPLAAAGLVLLMLGAIVFHVRRREYPNIGLNAVLGILAAIVAWGRFGPYHF